jgi:hydrogenase maturation protein HypF
MIKRVKIIIKGVVQGVGFRPFVFNLASLLELKGWVINSSEGVFIEAEGDECVLQNFIFRVEKEKPPLSFIQSFEYSFLDAKWYTDFKILHSDDKGSKSALILPDIAICDKCLEEIFNPDNRRYLYPFTNCTNCGPRYSIIEQLPYDRRNTTMSLFEMCDECKAEYENPKDRRFHAQPNACPKCGPNIELCDKYGKVKSRNHEALFDTVKAIKAGKIAAIKGIGGFHLVCDARNNSVIMELRKRKHREEKPMALMFPDIEKIKSVCEVSDLEERLLLSPESPIVLLRKKNYNLPKQEFRKEETGVELEFQDELIADSVAEGNPYLGIMLPYSPLHHILMRELKFPIVATSGNISDEPICINNNEAFERLKNIADLFLVHDRPIKRHVDDSIVRIMAGREMIVRRARGYAPLPVHLNEPVPEIIAAGAHLKNTAAISKDDNVFVSQHIGDLETAEAYNAFENVIADISKIYDVKPEAIACDMHPDYLSTSYANNCGLNVIPVQHHYAHIISCMTENEIEEPALGISWDGTGFGTDGTIWGGEFLKIHDVGFERFAHLMPFRLPGGDKAIKEVWRIKAGLLYEMYGDDAFEKYKYLFAGVEDEKLNTVKQMLIKNINSPYTSSAGRLFDAVSSIIGITNYANYEGQAAMMLEFSADENLFGRFYDFDLLRKNNKYIIDWSLMIKSIIEDLKKQNREFISAKFHNTLVKIITVTAQLSEEEKVVLSGGCFQNKFLLERCITQLMHYGFKVYWHQRVPTNDGGISLGQLASTAKILKKEKEDVLSSTG